MTRRCDGGVRRSNHGRRDAAPVHVGIGVVVTMHVIVFRATLIDESVLGEHESIVAEMRRLATELGGCLAWRDSLDGLTYWGYVLFESDESLLAWKHDPRHADLRLRGERQVYAEFATHVFAEVRHGSWRSDPAAG